MVKISQLPSDTPATGDYVPGLQASSTSTKRFSFANLITLIFNNVPPNKIKANNLALSNALDSSNGVQTYTPTLSGQSGGSWTNPLGYYINLGGLKIAWGTVSFASTGTTGHCLCSQPSSFFTTVQIGIPAIMSEGNNAFQVASGDTFSTTLAPFYVSNTSSNGSCVVSWITIGT